MIHITNMSEWGKIQIYTGDGKGKTTAALGTAMRAWSIGKKVVFVYFDKGGEHYSESKLLDKLSIEYHRFGLDRMNSENNKFRFGVLPEDQDQGQRALDKIHRLIDRQDVDLLVLDEILVSASLGIISEQEVLDIINRKSSDMELILTGRNATKALMEKSDLVTDMKIVKHYFYQGKSARIGLDY